ncbi:hypothetical protein BV25DRAFT_940664 [Artomyces pyxidatus]|uniref:Uncharacterized protein n=1 Tax=Artomyces pyxidatus TaxID=48021 RepID=A0ACB8SVP7_9AGAM|nr:hypothetical protein BV25DRAFT_940664 [Artomyces pyxidatus]
MPACLRFGSEATLTTATHRHKAPLSTSLSPRIRSAKAHRFCSPLIEARMAFPPLYISMRPSARLCINHSLVQPSPNLPILLHCCISPRRNVATLRPVPLRDLHAARLLRDPRSPRRALPRHRVPRPRNALPAGAPPGAVYASPLPLFFRAANLETDRKCPIALCRRVFASEDELIHHLEALTVNHLFRGRGVGKPKY